MRPCCAILTAGLVCFLQGCVPGVGWLPDSSGFVCTSAKGHLIVYDLATKKHRVILQDPAAATTCWPAIGPKSKRIALAHVRDDREKKTAFVQFVVCNLDGKIEFRSDEFRLATYTGRELEYTAQIAWSPDESKLLIHGQGLPNGGYGFDAAALFDLGTKKLHVWNEHVPAYFSGTPVRPDGKGFLLAKLKSRDGVGEYAWVDWNGKEQRIPLAKGEEVSEPAPPFTALLDSHWDGGKAILTGPPGRYVIDTEKLEYKVVPVQEAESKVGKEYIAMRTRFTNGLELLLLASDGGDKGQAVRAVVRKPGAKELTEILPAIGDRMVVLSRSPDGKHAIVRVTYGYRGAKGDTITIIDDAGRVVDTLDVYREFGGK